MCAYEGHGVAARFRAPSLAPSPPPLAPTPSPFCLLACAHPHVQFAFKDEDGLPTVEIVGDFTPTVRLLAMDTAEMLRMRDGFRKFKVCVWRVRGCRCVAACLPPAC